MADDKKCERCGGGVLGYNLLDYCATCGKDLCDKCMRAGCCGATPAVSGTAEDFGLDDTEAAEVNP